MPRVTLKADEPESTEDAVSKINLQNTIKKEVVTPGEQVFHRKSARRRMARDIFLVFEEQPSSRRGSSKKNPRPKSKFGHLKVDDPNKAKTKNLLRDIKNEPKCYLNGAGCANNKTTRKPQQAILKPTKGIHTTPCDNDIARVNPIFLWAKQDDTRIIEVRCEDYDKRNRIRITKTTNGWRAIPRTDPTSSRIVKLFQTPLFKLKREVYENQMYEKANETTKNLKKTESESEQICLADTNNIKSNIQLGYPAIFKNSLEKPKKKVDMQKKRKGKRGRPKKSIVTSSSTDDVEKLNEKCTQSTPNCRIENTATAVNCVLELPEESTANSVCEIDTTDAKTINNEIEEIRKYANISSELQLCPKTGLFVPNERGADGERDLVESSSDISLVKGILANLVDCELECNDRETQELAEGLDAETKNLKDLLDDADLLQHCSDNGNSGTELIDSLVKRSCENNLIQENEAQKDSLDENIFSTSNTNDFTQKDNEVLPQIIDTVSDPPKCLSFNEAGEIEGLNGELFQSNNYIDTFDKETIDDIQISSKVTSNDTNTPLSSSPILQSNVTETNFEDTPKDLSYKKREEVCPPSESRSQCAVTSSSDVVKSTEESEIPAIESTSDTIKNLLLEQFMKLNTLGTISSSPGIKQQSEPIDLGKQRDSTVSDSSNYAATTNYVETVVIDDNSNDEPMKKRLRNADKGSITDENALIIDKDPDPLTQLQLLIKNTQWKVPDPILVPKDRLSAVLASPAREIPLLITTRPELRLPEAFAYPEIIQNPNILVISMAQLEAILKNEMKMEKTKNQKSVSNNESQTEKKQKQQNANKTHNEPKSTQSKDISTKCPHIESSLASDINAATFAVLNQMLWLPYFGQISQDFIKSFKDPVDNQNKYSNILPVYNHQFGLQHLDDLYKTYMKQLSNMKHFSTDSSNHQSSSVYPAGMGTFRNPMELAFFEKLIQHQMHNLLGITSLPNDAIQKETNMKHSSNEHSSDIVHNNCIEKKDSKKLIDEANPLLAKLVEAELKKNNNGNIELSEKSISLTNIKANCDNSMQADNSEFSKLEEATTSQKQLSDNKPRLTCKSLSNLLDPENMKSGAVPLINLTSEAIRHDTNGSTDTNAISKEVNAFSKIEVAPIFKSQRHNNNKYIPGQLNSIELAKLRKRNIHLAESAPTDVSAKTVENMNVADSNQALWHPLFGSNTKIGYSSPWHWTTVTATGE